MPATMATTITFVEVVLTGKYGQTVFIIIKVSSFNQFLAHLSVFLITHLSLSAVADLLKNKCNGCDGYRLYPDLHNGS
jgi:hypothetical protein